MKTSERIRIRLESFNYNILISSCQKIIDILQLNNINQFSLVSLPMNKRIYCVLRSPHVDKDSREHFEIRIHKKILDIWYDPNINIYYLLSKSDLPPGILYQICLS